MDLREAQNYLFQKRHPWELSRVNALRSILYKVKSYSSPLKVLDVGCGDGFASSEIYKNNENVQIDAVDINLSEEFRDKLKLQFRKIDFYNSFNSIENRIYDIILVLDVIEHQENDSEFICNIIDKYANNDTKVLITAPAFNYLFSL